MGVYLIHEARVNGPRPLAQNRDRTMIGREEYSYGSRDEYNQAQLDCMDWPGDEDEDDAGPEFGLCDVCGCEMHVSHRCMECGRPDEFYEPN